MSETILDAEDGASSPASPESIDPSSLRALALRTLKRRKLPTTGNSGLPQRPPTTDTSLQLDYGQEDIGSSLADVAMPAVLLKPSRPNSEDGQMREEGEISDSEEASSKAASKRALAVDTPTIVKVESPTHNLFDRTKETPQSGSSFPVSLGECIVDPDHVRPGLALNQEQYDTAKDIVLDLLGWGVPPDYLVDCNLSREIVYYVFSELNLRLPRNLDITGLIPYTPAHVALYSRPLSAIPSAARPAISAPSRLHPSLPPKPLAGLNDAIAPGPSPMQRPSGPSSPPPHPPSPPGSTSDKSSLHDMERQRRQELLARKAVQASRKIKPPSDASSTASSSYAPADLSGVQDQDVEMAPAIASEAVDDFLKTIGEKSVTPEAPIQAESNDTMEVDEIPGLGGSSSSSHAHSSEVATSSDQVVISPTETISRTAPNRSLDQSDAPPTSGETDTTTFELEQASSDERLSQHQALQRRGAKRPTAADFVDFDAGSRNGHHHHHHHHPGFSSGSVPNALRRKTASFANVSGHRKLVIDLSDSEGEPGEDYVMQDFTESERWEGGSGYSSPAPGRYLVASAGGGGRATPPTMTPAALMEKEKEIRKMRELIAQREKSRMQKALSRSSMTVDSQRQETEDATGSTAPTSSNGSLQEDGPILVDKPSLLDVIRADAESATTSASATPPHIDSSEEVMGDRMNGSQTLTPGAQDSLTADVNTEGQSPANDTSMEEAPQEPVAGQVDVDSTLSSSTQTKMSVPPRPDESRPISPDPLLQEGSRYNYYAPYNSPFASYPLLRLRSQRMPSDHPAPSDQNIPNEIRRSPTSTTCSPQSSLSSLASSSSLVSSITSLPSSSSSTYNSVLPLPSLTPLLLTTCSALDPGKRICQYEVPGGGVCRDAGCEDLHLVGGLEPSDHDTAQYLCDLLPSAWQSQHGVSVSVLAASLQEVRGKNRGLGLEECVVQALSKIVT